MNNDDENKKVDQEVEDAEDKSSTSSTTDEEESEFREAVENLLKELDSSLGDFVEIENLSQEKEDNENNQDLSKEELKKKNKEIEKKKRLKLKEFNRKLDAIYEKSQPKISMKSKLTLWSIRFFLDLSLFIILNSILKPISCDFWLFIVIPVIYTLLVLLGRSVTRKLASFSLIKQYLSIILTSIVSFSLVILLFYEIHLIIINNIGLLCLLYLIMFSTTYFVMYRITPLILKANRRKEKKNNE